MKTSFQFCIGVITLLSSVVYADAVWSTWSAWSPCTTSCGYGLRIRARTCMSDTCVGPSEMHTSCMMTDCNDEGNISLVHVWSDWGEWSECTRTCGGGTRTRVRTCSSGNVTDCCELSDPDSCALEYTQSRECINDDCYGTWSDWRQWGSCSVLCGEGMHSRTRDCEPAGSICIGVGEQTRGCYIQCPESQTMISSMDEATSCENNNPCENNGICATDGDHVTCICTGDWRGRYCNTKCLYANDKEACSNKRGIFYDCANCNRFIICSRTGNLVSMTCTPDRMWNGNGCSLVNETKILCIENSIDGH